MSKKKLFDDDSEQEEVSFKTENEYAKKYDNWREKEELYKLEQKYGSKALTSDASLSSDSEDDDDEPPEVSEVTEAQFLKTLSLLKAKDPRIYDPGFKFFDEKTEKVEEPKPKEKTLTFEDSDDDESDNDGNIFKVEKKAEIKAEKKPSDGEIKKGDKEGKLKDFLIGKAKHIDQDVEQELAPLKALWSDPKLNEGEAFLRDYILNKKYLEEGDAGEAEDKIRDDEDLEEDEKLVEEQGKFERAYNFRFEEPDEEYLKRYPRTMNYTRPKDDRRSKKRAELRARKEEEKRRKMDEIARLKALKLKEIQEKIAKIKEVTGNEDLAFKEEDIEGDFDPEEHDRRMKALFDEEFYGGQEDQKPVFPDLDEELEIENWEKYEGEYDGVNENTQQADGPHCEDEDFNMDADYDPKRARATLLEEIQSTLGKKRRNRKKKSKLAQILASEKPKFVPTVAQKTYDQYMEEYYKMDCEDVIGGDLPTRFKYREVVPNDYGLSIEEILLADDRELTQWVPLKRLVKHRPQDVERSEVNTYRQKAADAKLKRKILPSLFKDLPEEPEIAVPVGELAKKKKKNKKKKENTEHLNESETTVIDNSEQDREADVVQEGKKKKNKAKIENSNENEAVIENSEQIQSQEGKRKTKKHKVTTESFEDNTGINDESNNEKTARTKKKKHTKAIANNSELIEGNNIEIGENLHTSSKKKKKQANATEDSSVSGKSSDIQNADHSVQKSNEIGKSENRNEDNNIQVSGGANQNSKNKKKKKKHKSDGFTVEIVQKAEPSHTGHEGIQKYKNDAKLNNKPNLKRKLDGQNQVPNKKQKKKGFEKKFNHKDTSDNPLNKLSDERLKAYGLNPKKYKNFLKYKKF